MDCLLRARYNCHTLLWRGLRAFNGALASYTSTQLAPLRKTHSFVDSSRLDVGCAPQGRRISKTYMLQLLSFHHLCRKLCAPCGYYTYRSISKHPNLAGRIERFESFRLRDLERGSLTRWLGSTSGNLICYLGYSLVKSTLPLVLLPGFLF